MADQSRPATRAAIKCASRWISSSAATAMTGACIMLLLACLAPCRNCSVSSPPDICPGPDRPRPLLESRAMKAIQISRTGGPDVLDLVDLPTPKPGPGEVLVKAEAIGVN